MNTKYEGHFNKTAVIIVAGSLMAGSLAIPAAKAHEADELAVFRQASKAFVKVAKQASPAVVSITAEHTLKRNVYGSAPHPINPFHFFGDEWATPRQRDFKQQGTGSGFIITKDGYILTNHHVVGDAEKITVVLSDGREYPATLIGTDDKSEVALIKIDSDKDLPTVPVGDSAALDIGEWVIAIGNPFRLQQTLTVGVVSALGRSSLGIADYEDFIQTDAAINPGNSGGPLLNLNGEVIGINTAIYSGSGGYIGIGFAIPINMAISIKDQLLTSGKVVRGYLGIYLQEVTPENASHFGMKEASGILIADVMDDSEAKKAGLQPGDVILKLDGEAVGSLSGFRNRVSSKQPGTELALTIMRDGKIEVVEARTGGLPGAEVADAKSSEVLDKLGISVEELNGEMATRLGVDLSEGVVITQVNEEGLGAASGLRPGQLIVGVNHKPVGSVSAFKKALSSMGDASSVLLRVRQGPFSRFVVINLN